MCLSCGCNKASDDHGDKRNITTQSLEQAAQAGEVGSAAEVVKNIQKGFDAAGSGGGTKNEMAGAAAGKSKQPTGANEQLSEKRQGGYSGGSSGPQ